MILTHTHKAGSWYLLQGSGKTFDQYPVSFCLPPPAVKLCKTKEFLEHCTDHEHFELLSSNDLMVSYHSHAVIMPLTFHHVSGTSNLE